MARNLVNNLNIQIDQYDTYPATWICFGTEKSLVLIACIPTASFREIREIYETPSKYDLKQFSGILIFPPGEMSENITITTIPDTEEEANEAFAVRLLAARVIGNNSSLSVTAEVSSSENAAILTGGVVAISFYSRITTTFPLKTMRNIRDLFLPLLR